MKKIFFLCLIFFACSEQDENTVCISFDQRQCDRDPWSETVDRNSDADTQAEQFKLFLKDRGIETLEIRIDPFFHQAVCEACFVCPDGLRIFLEIKEDQLVEIEGLDPLNLEVIDCSAF